MADHAFTCNLCEALCGLTATVEDGRVTALRGNENDVLSRGHLCPKGPAMRELYEDPDRLRAPMRRTKGGWDQISWDDALDETARRLRAIRKAHGRHAVGYYVGNPSVHSHRASIGMSLLQIALGTRNRFDANSSDSNPRLFACMHLYGDALSMPVPDVDRTELLVIIGANPAASNGSMMTLGDVRGRLRGIRERGGRMVVIDPRRSETAESYADQHLFIRPGGDAALLLAILHVLFAERLVDEEAVSALANGVAAIRAAAARFSPERVEAAVGIAADEIRRLARAIGRTRRAVVYGRVGTCQNEFGPTANWLIEVVNVVSGHFDVEGGAMFPQPAADVGPLARLLVGNHYDRWRSRVRGLPELLGTFPAAAMAEEMETEGEGRIRGFVCFAGNPVLSTPNGDRLARAMAGLEFSVSIDIYLNETSRLADLVLPPSHVFESGNFDLVLLGLAVRNVVKYSAPILPRTPGARDDWEILSDLAMRVAGPGFAPLERAWRRVARDLPERVIDLLLRMGRSRLTLAKLRAAPDGIDLGPLGPARHEKVRTGDGMVALAPPPLMADLPRVERWLDERAAGGVVLIGRRHLRSNNSWMHNARSLAKGPDRARLMVHPRDAARLGIAAGQAVRVRSRVGAVETLVEVSDQVMEGVVSLPHGYGHAGAQDTMHVAGALPGPSANSLTDELLIEPLCGTSIMNGVPVTIEPVDPRDPNGPAGQPPGATARA